MAALCWVDFHKIILLVAIKYSYALQDYMIELSFEITIPDFSRHELEVECPLCDLHNWTTFGQVQRRDFLICRGCNCNIFLEDHLGSVQRSIKGIEKALRQLGKL